MKTKDIDEKLFGEVLKRCIRALKDCGRYKALLIKYKKASYIKTLLPSINDVKNAIVIVIWEIFIAEHRNNLNGFYESRITASSVVISFADSIMDVDKLSKIGEEIIMNEYSFLYHLLMENRKHNIFLFAPGEIRATIANIFFKRNIDRKMFMFKDKDEFSELMLDYIT